ncbi:MAG: sulfatase-like hydrolase/transferase, partial [Verrucomicrobiae bacterium]|nr:sulfatase-like hydrolase/transferase [Verrucomicrobiae bacterium]
MKPSIPRSLFAAALLACPILHAAAPSPPPNVVYLMADELGYYEPGFMGGKTILTPNLDRMAAEGMVFTNLLAGSSVCAPTRCCFLTGKHSGHTSVRVNGGGTPMRAEEETVASMLKPLGYATGGFGKWGNGGRDSTGVPEKHGFDVFFGYYDQVHAHSYYPPYLIRNSEEVPLPGNKGLSQGDTYSHYLIHQAAMDFIRENAKRPFFAYLPYTPPHGIFDIPDDDPAWALYKDKPWPEEARRYAAMVGMVDRQVGEIIALLKELGVEDNTLFLFSGDNGGADYFVTPEFPRGVHSANKNPANGVEYRGKKGTLYEGGLRIPFVARWPGRIAPGSVSDFLGYFPDLLPTIAELSGAKAPADIDGVSFLPTLTGQGEQKRHDFLYWEMGNQAAIRQGDWRAVKGNKSGWELYDLAADPSESKNLAADRPEELAKLVSLAEKAHAPAVEGSFSRTDRHERDRRAKTGQQDNPDAPDPLTGRRKKGKTASLPKEGLIPNQDWKIVRFSSENQGNQKFARNAIDGDPDTLWHTRFSPEVAQPPHELVIDLGAERTVRGFVYLGRQDAGWNGAAKGVDFAVSDSAETFGDPLVKTELAKT